MEVLEKKATRSNKLGGRQVRAASAVRVVVGRLDSGSPSKRVGSGLSVWKHGKSAQQVRQAGGILWGPGRQNPGKSD